MNPIKKSGVVTNSDGDIFYKHVSEAINSFQIAGLDVEIQYQFSVNIFSAFIIGRGKENT